MQQIQTFLDYLALLPIATAFALFGFHMLNCWQRTGHSHQIPGSGNLAELKTGIPASIETEIEQNLDDFDQSDSEPQWTTAAKAMPLAQTVVILPEVLPAGFYHPSVENSESDSAIATLEKCPPFPAPQSLLTPIK